MASSPGFDPTLPLTGSPLRASAQLRADGDWLDQAWRSGRARVAVFRADKVGLTDVSDVTTAWSTSDDIRHEAQTWAFLGLDDSDHPHFVAALPEGAAAGAAEGDGGDTGAQPASWRSLRELAVTGQLDELAALTPGVALLNWHGTHQHCPRCGAATVATNAGWTRQCPQDESQHFPRVDPAVIMLARDSADRALLGRQRRWPQGWYSTLAGFVEPGEALETSVAREVAEEVSLVVTGVDYLGSQPWPFPSSLMLGFHARVQDGQPVPDGTEIADAVWVTRDDLVARCRSGEIRLPPRLSISRWLIERWFGDRLPGDWSRA